MSPWHYASMLELNLPPGAKAPPIRETPIEEKLPTGREFR
jgi:hypothetical protein